MQRSFNIRQNKKDRSKTLKIKLIPFKSLFSVLCLLSFVLFLPSVAFCQPPSPFAIDKMIGQKAPDFTLKDLNGNNISLSTFKGKVILLNFWASWCPPCRAEMPSMNKLNELLKKKGFVVIAVSTDRSVFDVKDYLSKNPVNFTVLIDYNLNVSRNLYKVFMMPTTFLIDRKGIIVKRYFGEQDWSDPDMIKEIEEIL
jgi:peroxiredoxin